MARVVAGMLAVALGMGAFGASLPAAAAPADATELAKGKKGKGKARGKGKKGKKRRGPGRARSLKLFSTCQDVVAYGDSNATAIRGAGYKPNFMPPFPPRPQPAQPGTSPPPVATAAPQAAAPKEGVDFSGTNTQVAGVDEPDIVKTNGDTVFAIGGNGLHALDAQTATPVLLDSLRLEGFNHQMFLVGTKLLLISEKEEIPEAVEPPPIPSPAPDPSPTSGSEPPHALSGPVTLLTEIDVSNPSALTVLKTEEVDGEYVSARLVANQARIVVSTPPAATLAPPSSLRSELGGWVPYSEYTNELSGASSTDPVLDGCGEIGHPAKFSGLDMVSVLTVDINAGLPVVDAEGVMTDGEIVYASSDSLYVTTERYLGPSLPADPSRAATAIHRFDISKPGASTYVSTGFVRGRILNQFSMDEYKGDLRVASTGKPEGRADEGGDESFVSVLKTEGRVMRLMGRVGNLGRGERIYAVRMIGDEAYVVTFRQVDPLYTIDLSDPNKPEVIGELKILGYSAYLHPIGDDLLIGVGAAATKEGLRQGAQISLFDVSDLEKPMRLDNATLLGTRTSIEDTHLAFLYWAPKRRAMVPVTGIRRGSGFVGAIGFDVSRKKIRQAGAVEHGVIPSDEILRSLVIDNRIYTLSCTGVEVSGMDKLIQIAAASFPDPDVCRPPPINFD